MRKIKFLFEGNFELAGRDRHYTEGTVEDADDVDAARLVEGLCAEYADTPKPKVNRKANAQANKKDGE